jgi:dTDP-D-glucose 4,6-dehydratase
MFGTHVLLEDINKYGKVKRFYHVSTNELVHEKQGSLHSHGYLYAGDAAEAFDTILHKGEIGEAYNVDSQDEVSEMLTARQKTARPIWPN